MTPIVAEACRSLAPRRATSPIRNSQDDADIASFCQHNYGVSFTITEKVSVRADPHPLWDDLARQPGSAPPVWNFSKYLVGGDGKLIARFSSRVQPDAPELVDAIETALKPTGRSA